MSNSWFRSWHGAPTDPKWLGIARKAGVAPGMVAALVWALLDRASQAVTRGSIEGYDADGLACFFGMEPEQVEAVIASMQDKGVLDGLAFSGWEKHQPKREDNSAERAREWRERNQTQLNATEQKQTLDTDTDTDTDIPNHLGACELETLEKQLREAAGWQSDPSTNLFVTGPVHQLIVAGGCSLELDVLPTIRSKAPRLKGRKNWNYFLEAIQQARDDRLSAARPPDLTNARGTHANTQSRNSIASSFAVVDAAIAAREAELERLEAGAGIGRKGVELLS